MDEKRRIETVYEQRDRTKPGDFYSLIRPGNLFMLHSRERSLCRILADVSIPLKDCSVLDVGCGTGHELRSLIKYGFSPENLSGIDLLGERIQSGKRISPNLDLREGDATKLPWPDRSFDLVTQSTVFSSIVDPLIQQAVAQEILRVLKPGGKLLWYDMRVTDPRNDDLVSIGMRRIRELFPDCRLDLRPHTLNPLLVRPLAPHARALCIMLEALPLLRSHLFGAIEKVNSEK